MKILNLSLLGLLLFNMLMDPSMAFGRSVGMMGLLILTGINCATFGLSAAIGNFALVWSGKKSRLSLTIYSIAVLTASLGLNLLLFQQIDRDYDLGRTLATSKIEYFCFTSFDAESCVARVHECVDCANQVDKWKRDIAREKLSMIRKSLAQGR